MEFRAWGGIDLLVCMSDMGCTGMSEDNAAIAGRHLDGFGAHFGGFRMDSGLTCFGGRKVVVL